MASSESISNGVETPPTQEDSITSNSAPKRKREDTDDAPLTNGNGDKSSHPPEPVQTSPECRQSLKDILIVLRKHDTTPSLLDLTLSTEQDASNEPPLKRTKLSTGPATTIATRIDNELYSDLDALVKDVDVAATELLAPIKAKETQNPPSQYGRPTTLLPQETRLWTATTALQKLLGDLVQAEKERQKLIKAGKLASKAPSAETTADGRKVKEETEETEAFSDGKPVLTLFANAPGPKQLFSSFQQPVTVDGRKAPEGNGVIPALRESGLPSFVSTTSIPTVPAEAPKKNGKGPTIGELFAPPSTLPRLQPPKPAKSKLTTTGNTVEFVRVDTPVKTNRRSDYNWYTDKLAVGQWLGYGGVDTPQEPTSPQAKRKQRDRALSTGEAFMAPTEGEKAALKQAKDDALFRRVYGSFAPSHDDSIAVVPKDVRNEVWMSKVEERLAQKTVVIDPALLGDGEPQDEAEKEKELESLKKAVDEFDPEAFKWESEEEKVAKEMDEVLEEISDLLETLSSYQRIRNSSLNTSSRTTVGQNNPLTDLMGSPSTPSSAEMEVYKTLKLQLAVMVNQLPPYAVARLNGDQLAELNIKNSIIIETEDARGVMTEDETSRAVKMQAFAAAAGTQQAAQAGRTSSSSAFTGSQHRTPAPQPPLRPTGPQGYYTPQQQTQVRPGPVPYQRTGSGVGVQTFSSGYPTTAPRPSSYSQQNFNHATPRQGSYSAAGGSQFFQPMQQVPAKQAGYTQQFNPGTPQAHRPSYQQTPASSYPRPANTAPMYSGFPQTQSPHARTASPLTTAAAGGPTPSQYSQARPNYSASGSGSQNSSFYRPPVSGAPGQFGSSQYRPSGIGAPNAMTPARQSSGTPQPPQPTGVYPQGGMNGTPMVSQQSS